MAASVGDENWLRWLEGLVGKPAELGLPNLPPPSLFCCRLDEQPDHLVPGHFFRTQDWADPRGPVVLNPSCCFSREGRLPPELAGIAGLLSGFALQQEVVWIQHAGTGAWQPYWVDHATSQELIASPGRDFAAGPLPAAALRALIMAGILGGLNFVAQQGAAWKEAISHGAGEMQRKSYAPLRGLIHPFHISALRRYFRYLIRTNKVPFGDRQCPGRYVADDDAVARFFHYHLAPFVAAIVGEPVKPSYAYVVSYQEGAELHKHTDREQCEFSITLCLDFTPEPHHATAWPIHLYTSAGRVTLFQAIGDALLYRGRELPHSRDLLPRGFTSTSMLFHYVREDFCGRLN